MLKVVSRLLYFVTFIVFSAFSFPSVVMAGNVNVFRLFNSKTGDHFYTTDFYERVNNSCTSFMGYMLQGPAFRAYPTASGGHSPVYRMYSPSTKHHFYTISAVERDSALSHGFNYEGVAYYANTSQQGGDVPVYRLYASVRNDHFYTTSIAERDSILNDPHPAIPYVDEGIAFWTNPNASMQIYRLLKWSDDNSSGFSIWDHFYTDARETDSLPCSGPQAYRYEGKVFSVYSTDTGGLLAVRRFYKPSTGNHFYTTSSQETGFALADGYTDEGIAFYASPSATLVVDRFSTSAYGGGVRYMYVSPGEEHDYLISVAPHWQKDTSAFSADPLCTGSCTNPAEL